MPLIETRSMKKGRGFRIGRRLLKVVKWFVHGKARSSSIRVTCKQLKQSSATSRAMSKLCNWGRSLKHGAKGLYLNSKKHGGYIRVGQEPVDAKPVSVPKGHLAIYVGDKEEDTCRVVVPVIYFNHPLFADLLIQAEKVFGYNHQGGIQIPCQKSQFEKVKMRIAATSGGGRFDRRWA